MRLNQYLEINGINQKNFADQVKITPSMICYLLSGERTPGLKLALRIEKITKGKVRPEDWDSHGI